MSNREVEWFEEARFRSEFPWDYGNMDLTIKSVDEPPCEGHNEFMCTTSYLGTTRSDIYLRSGTTDLNHPMYGSVPLDKRKAFFLEACMHEIGHAFTRANLTTSDARKDLIAGWFLYMRTPGTGSTRYGTIDDWTVAVISETTEPWKNSLHEAIAEWFKDLYLPEQYRYHSQRTYWSFQREFFTSWWELLESFMCLGSPT